MSTTQKADVISDLIVKLGVKFDRQPLDEAVAGLNALRDAADQAREALARLGEFEHGGVTINMVGSVMTCEIKPPAVEISGQPVD